VTDQIIGLSLWFGIAGLALVWACIHLWHRGRALNRTQPGLGQRRRLAAAPSEAKISSQSTPP